MELLVDTHLHLYPCFDLDRALSGLIDRLSAHDAHLPHVGCLAERADCHFYTQLRAGEPLLRTFSIEPSSDALLVREKGSGRQLTLLPGRQIIAAERIEVLALCTEAFFADGVPAAELIRSIREQGGVPVLPWSPGKWMFRRGKVIDHLLRSFTPSDMLIGDVSLRPQGWPMPLLMRKARRLGYTIICGSDPLPFPGEERQLGRCGSRVVSVEHHSTPDDALRGLLNWQSAATDFGRRCGLLELCRRQRSNASCRSLHGGVD